MKRLLILVLILIISCNTPTGDVVREYTFEKGLAELKEIEEKYNTFHPSLPLTEQDTWAMFGEMNVLKNRVENMKQTNDIRALRYFLFFRWKAYESNIQLRSANNFALQQTADGTLICPTRPRFLSRIKHLDRTMEYGDEAIKYLNIFYKNYPEQYALVDLPLIYPKVFEASYIQLEDRNKKEKEIVVSMCELEI